MGDTASSQDQTRFPQSKTQPLRSKNPPLLPAIWGFTKGDKLGDNTAAAAKSEIMKEDKLGRQHGSGSQERNHDGRQAWETTQQRQPRAKSWRETNLGDNTAVEAKSEIMKRDKIGRWGGSGSHERNHEGRQVWDNTAAAAKSEIMKGHKFGRQGGSGSQERNHDGRQAWETRRQRQPRAKSWRDTSLEDKAAAAAKSEIMKGDKLGRHGSGSQEWNHEGRQTWETTRQWQPRAKSWRETSLGDKAAAAAKSEIMKGHKLGRRGGNGSQERNHWRGTSLGDKAAAAANFRNQEPSHWEIRTPIASSYLGNKSVLDQTFSQPFILWIKGGLLSKTVLNLFGQSRTGTLLLRRFSFSCCSCTKSRILQMRLHTRP